MKFIYLLFTRNTSLMVLEWNDGENSHGIRKQVDIAVLIDDKIDFKLKPTRRDNEDILTNGIINQEENHFSRYTHHHLVHPTS